MGHNSDKMYVTHSEHAAGDHSASSTGKRAATGKSEVLRLPLYVYPPDCRRGVDQVATVVHCLCNLLEIRLLSLRILSRMRLYVEMFSIYRISCLTCASTRQVSYKASTLSGSLESSLDLDQAFLLVLRTDVQIPSLGNLSMVHN